MIPSGVKVFLASQPVDFRKGPDSLLSLVRDAGSDPFSGALYIFRAKRADRIKIVWVGWQRGLYFCQAARKIRLLLAAYRACPGPAEPSAAHGAGGWSGLEAGAPPSRKSSCIRRLIWPQRSEETGLRRRNPAACPAGMCYL